MKTLIIALILALFAPCLLAQDKFDFDYKIDSKAFGTERKFYVHLNENYYKNQSDSLGVIFILDAQGKTFFNNAKAIIDYLVWSYEIPQMIVVGIHSENRHTEFIPLDKSMKKEDPKNIGQAEKLRMHLKEEIFPMLEDSFRTNEFKALIGHSRAGAFIANTIFSESNDLFNAYIAISPGMHYLNRQILNEAQSMIKENAIFNNFYYCTHGTVGSLEPYFAKQVSYLDSLFTVYPNKTIHWGKKELAGKTHWTVVAPSIVEGLVEMNRAYKIDQLLIEEFSKNEDLTLKEQFDTYIKQQKEKLKFVIPNGASDLRYYANEMKEVGMYKRAVELYDLSLDINRNQLNVYLAKADALIHLKDFTAAKNVYESASDILELNEAQLSPDELAENKLMLQEHIAKIKNKEK